jgi:hypothetical protein
MASLRNIADAVAQVLLRSKTPEPLPVDLRNELPSHASVLVKEVIDRCRNLGVNLALVRIDNTLSADMWRDDDAVFTYNDVPVEQCPALNGRVEFYRSNPRA